MSDYGKLVEALWMCNRIDRVGNCNECFYGGPDAPAPKQLVNGCKRSMCEDAAAAIEDLQAKVPHWVSVEHPPKGNGAFAACCVYDGKTYWFKAIYLDGKWLREMDGVELPVNYWMEIPQPTQEVQDDTD